MQSFYFCAKTVDSGKGVLISHEAMSMMWPFSHVYGLSTESGCLAYCDRSQATIRTRLSSPSYHVTIVALHAVSRCYLITDLVLRFEVPLWRFTLTRRGPSIVSFSTPDLGEHYQLPGYLGTAEDTADPVPCSTFSSKCIFPLSVFSQTQPSIYSKFGYRG